MKLYKDYKEKKERDLQEEADRQYLNRPDVVIIYEDGTGRKAGSFLLALLFLLAAGTAVGYVLIAFL